MGDSLTVERLTLDQVVGVRVPVPQPTFLYPVLVERQKSIYSVTQITNWFTSFNRGQDGTSEEAASCSRQFAAFLCLAIVFGVAALGGVKAALETALLEELDLHR